MPTNRSRKHRDQLLALYLRGHLVGASGGLRLAQLVASDPWVEGTLDHLPEELLDEIGYVRRWAASLSRFPELWVRPALAVTAGARVVISPLRLTRGEFSRVIALEAMRSLVLAKKAMWELGIALEPADGAEAERLRAWDHQAARQAEELKELHRLAAIVAFGDPGDA